ncbi:MAG: glycoside hydrolase [Actinomycetota bacterium]|nr:glycoside hydrolase [Actinomycetota bacterium]
MRLRAPLAVLVPFLFVATVIAPQVARATDTPTTDPAPGWVGERVVNPVTDDWEPAVAADPNSPYVYIITTRFGQPKPCPNHCPTPWMALTVSSNGGKTWSDDTVLCPCHGSKAQYDPVIEVVPDTGDVYAMFLNGDRAGGLSAVFIKSSNHGQTWTAPVHVYGRGRWTDKPEVTMSPDGSDVYASWNGVTKGDLWIGVSHDAGETWTQTRVVRSIRYFFAYDAKMLPDGTVLFSESSFNYTGPAQTGVGKVWHHAIISRNEGRTWENVIVGKVEIGPTCASAGCYADFHTGQTSISTDDFGHLVFAYEGATTPYAPQHVYVKTSADEGRTWSRRTALSTNGQDAGQPRIAATGNGDERLWYMQTSDGGIGLSWNVWYRSSTDGGLTWSDPVKISDAPAGAASYITADGFGEVYGDYGEIAITNRGKTIGVWGEAPSYNGPGGTWFKIQS